MAVTLHDSSGNSNDGVYGSNVGYPKSVSGLVAGDAAIQWGNFATIVNTANAGIPHGIMDWTGDFSIEFWAQFGPGPGGGGGRVIAVTDGGGFPFVYLFLDSAGNIQLVRQTPGPSSEEWDFTIGADEAPHYYALNYLSSVATLDVDLSPATLGFSDTPVVLTASAANVSLAFDGSTGHGARCILDELAIYPAGLDSTQQAAHVAAASSSFAAYTAAVLADVPAAYYHLDETFGTPSGWHLGRLGVG